MRFRRAAIRLTSPPMRVRYHVRNIVNVCHFAAANSAIIFSSCGIAQSILGSIRYRHPDNEAIHKEST
ncbi:acetoacetate decarboxylase domain protein [Burkholderia pseudomallei MSHR5609]|nr:acetoacetate decarboxylase domain protein [Burkholderia pseudomallei MSHR5609]